MPCTTAARILVAGHISPSTSFTLKQLEREGCAIQYVDTTAEAELSLRAARFDIVLAGEILSDGRGYDLTEQRGEPFCDFAGGDRSIGSVFVATGCATWSSYARRSRAEFAYVAIGNDGAAE